MPTDIRLTRRRLLQLGLALPLPVVLAACDDGAPPGPPDPTATTAATAGGTLAPTPACDDGDDPTPAQTEGPYFTPNSPLKASFLGDVSSGTRLALSGLVVTTACAPVAGALVDLWHADDGGEYDNTGYRLRGHQFADDRGAWA